MSLEDSKLQCYQFTIAGQDTTAGLISGLVSCILSSAAVHSKLLAEIATFEQQRKISQPIVHFDETANMPFFMACVHETLRVAPPTPVILPRYVSKEGMVINGIWVPEKTELAANPYIIHRNKEVFGSDADIFRPERWLVHPRSCGLWRKTTLHGATGTGNALARISPCWRRRSFACRYFDSIMYIDIAASLGSSFSALSKCAHCRQHGLHSRRTGGSRCIIGNTSRYRRMGHNLPRSKGIRDYCFRYL